MFQLTLLNHTLLASCTWLYNIYFTYPRSFFCFSEGIRTRFALVFGDSVIFILWFNLLEFLWIYFTEKKIQAKFDFIILRWINHKTPPLSLSLSLSLSNRVQYSANTKNQIYSTLLYLLDVIYPYDKILSLWQQSLWQNLCVIIIEWLFFKTPKKQKI